eukprot:gene18724-20613_t
MAHHAAPRQGGNVNRQRLRPWLIDQINSGTYIGLKWIDQDQMIFQISWKHFGKPGVDEERDAKIFREWARHTGKFKDGDPPDPSTWKTRFRCALYKLQDIEEINSMNMLDGDEPYRVYRFRSREEVERENQRNAATFNHEIASPTSIDSEANDDSNFPMAENLMEDMPDWTSSIGTEIGIGDPDDFFTDLSRQVPSDYPPTTTGNITSSSRIPLSAPVVLKVQLYNKAKELGDPKIVSNPTGCRIAFRAPPPLPDDVASEENAQVVSHIFGPFQAEQIYFPETDDPDTVALLGYMRRGLVLQTHNKDIYATRLCQAKIYYSISAKGDPAPFELRREHTTKVFDYHNTFTPLLTAALHGHGPPPRAELYFSFGQKWGGEAMLNDNLVHVCVTHQLADNQLKAFFAKSTEVLLSEPNALDVIARQIEDISINTENTAMN